MAKLAKFLQGVAGAAGGAGLNVEDVFSTYLYDGNSSTQTITNGIDLSGEGGLVWISTRNNAGGGEKVLIDTERGATKRLRSYSTDSEATDSTGLTAFNSDGFSLGNDSGYNYSTADYASWTFRKAPKFFDVVTYTGTGSTQNISHNLGSVPAVVIVKRTSSAEDWLVYHRSTGNQAGTGLNETAATYTGVSAYWNSTTPTDSVFTVGTHARVNTSGQTYVAYLFAHNDGDGGFGSTADQDIIKCGSFTTDSSGNASVNLGWEPQWLICKRSDGVSNWLMLDTMRGWSNTSINRLYADVSNADSSYTAGFPHSPTATGFQFTSGLLSNSATYIYIAIRRGPMAVPESATDVFDVNAITGNGTNDRAINTGFVTDVHLSMRRSSNYPTIVDRLRGHGSGSTKRLATHLTNAEQSLTGSYWLGLDTNDGYILSSDYENQSSQTYAQYAWKRAPNYFDVVAYTGTASSGNSFAPQNVSHNLDAVPEMMWVKCRSTGGSTTYRWHVYHKDVGNTKALFLNETSTGGTGAAYWNNTTPTDSVFRVGGGYGVNQLGETYIAYLFASVDGVSKVGSYTGNGSTLSIDCGFSSGPRFVLIKRTDSNGHWNLYDSERGITSTTSPVLRLNNTDAENSSYDDVDITPSGNGFIVDAINGGSVINASGGTYIFYAIA